MPDVLGKLTQDIRWTTDLGNAFLAQQADVMAAVQRMRARAQANGKLQSNAQETVTTDTQSGQSAIVIQPASPEVIYVPSYDPAYIWGPPAWGYYPSLYYPSYGFWWGSGINVGLYFGGWGGWGYGGWGWGWGPNWYGRSVFVNPTFFNHYGYRYGGGFHGFNGRTAWTHDPGHRLGVGYSNAGLSNRYGAASQASRIAAGRSGNYHSYGQNSVGSGYRNGGSQMNGARNNVQGAQGQGGYQRFQQGRQQYQAPAQRNNAPAMQQRYNAPAMQQRNNAPAAQQRYNSPAMQQRYSAPATQQRYSAPAMQQRYSAPSVQHNYSAPSAPHYSAPSAPRSFGGGGGGGGGARSFGGGGGGASHGGGSGGGSHGGGHR